MPKTDRVAACRGRVGHLIAKSRECAHGGDADEGEGAEARGALSRLVDEVWLRNPRRAMRERERERERDSRGALETLAPAPPRGVNQRTS